MRSLHRFCAVLLLCCEIAACATQRPEVAPRASAKRQAPSGGVYKVGNPYQIAGTWYYPREQPDYDETGIASWYGPTFYGRATANGEVYNAGDLTAAHRTLPLPVNVRITNLDNGKSLIVRVNDRGPYSKGRIIDVSEQAAKLLGFYGVGTARVRVSFVSRAGLPDGRVPDDTPPEIASAVPAAPAPKVVAQALPAVSDVRQAPPVRVAALPAPKSDPVIPVADMPTGQVTEVPVPAVTHLYVQVGAFSSYENAMRLRSQLGEDLRISTTKKNGQTLYRVRSAPLNTTADADATLARLSGLGSNDAHIVVDQ